MSTLHFLHPAWLLGVPLVIATVLAMHWLGRRNALWESVCDAHLLAALLEPAPRNAAKQVRGAGSAVRTGWAETPSLRGVSGR